MARNRWSDKANSQARINGQEYRASEPLMPQARAIDALMSIGLSETGRDATASPAERIRAEADQARRRISGEFKTVASIKEIKQGKGVYNDVVRRYHVESSTSDEGTKLTTSFPTHERINRLTSAVNKDSIDIWRAAHKLD